jgi:hypothetical protein
MDSFDLLLPDFLFRWAEKCCTFVKKTTMRTIIRTSMILFAFLFSVKAMTQGSSLTIFSEKNENFTVFLNGDQKNSKPADHVKIESLFGPSFKVRVVFQDVTIREISKTIFNSPSSDLYYVVKPGKKGEYILEHTSSDYSHPEGAVTEPAKATSQKESQTTEGKGGSTAKKGGGGCNNPMSEPDFQASTIAISNAPFDGIRLTQAKKVAENHCLECRQIVELMYILSSESSRLSLAKAAYTHCFDPGNYDQVKDVLNSNKSRDDLDRYIQSVK